MPIQPRMIAGYLNSLLPWLAITPEEVNLISKRIIQFIMTLMHSTKHCSHAAILPWALIVRSYKISKIGLPVAALKNS